jgi:hypothetical protein
MLIIEIAAGILLASFVLWLIRTLVAKHRERVAKAHPDFWQATANDPNFISFMIAGINECEDRERGEHARLLATGAKANPLKDGRIFPPIS